MLELIWGPLIYENYLKYDWAIASNSIVSKSMHGFNVGAYDSGFRVMVKV